MSHVKKGKIELLIRAIEKHQNEIAQLQKEILKELWGQ